MDLVIVTQQSVQTKLISGIEFRLIEIWEIATNGNPFHQIIKRIGGFYLSKYYQEINNQEVLVDCISNLGDDEWSSIVCGKTTGGQMMPEIIDPSFCVSILKIAFFYTTYIPHIYYIVHTSSIFY